MGQRRCIGETFGVIEMKIHIAYVCRFLKLKYIDEKPIRLETTINLRPEKDFFMHVSERH
jgi:cytochrome P450